VNDKVTLFGEVVTADGGSVHVRFDNDELAVLHEDGGLPPQIGYRGEFTVEGRSEDGRTIVALARPSGNAAEVEAFDLEFDRLHSALSGRPTAPRPAAPRTTSRSIQEEQIRDWSRRVDVVLSQLRKRRAKRLSESDES
jgi:hypothetical protein